jgi:Universal stress protein family
VTDEILKEDASFIRTRISVGFFEVPCVVVPSVGTPFLPFLCFPSLVRLLVFRCFSAWLSLFFFFRFRVTLQKIFASQIEAKKVKHIDLVEFGDARKVICEAVIKHSIDLLLLGDHSVKSLPGLLLGSVTDYCVKHAICTVTVVKDRAANATAAEEAEKKGGFRKMLGLKK